MTDDQSELTPAEALQRLKSGNERFVCNGAACPRRDVDYVKAIATNSQKPIAAFLGCADSRVPVEIVFDQGFGDLFVTRVAGNVVNAEIVGSLEFAAEILNVKIIYVLGHTSCGAVTATVKGGEVPGLISSIFHRIKPAAKAMNNDLDKTIVENARSQAEIIAETSPVISRKIREGKLLVVAGVYDITTGIVTQVPL
jgi:carbonic anhydrase